MKRRKNTSTLENTVEGQTTNYQPPIANVTVGSLDYLIGKVFTHTELLGLTDRQLSAYKSTVRQMFWDWYNNHLSNPNGLSDPSRQARIEAGLEIPTTTTTSTSGTLVTITN